MPSPLKRLADLLADKDRVPNKLTIAMGHLVRRAREEASLSQSQLADLIYRRQATISAIETGKSEVSAPTLVLLAAALDKPLSYFLPNSISKRLQPEPLDAQESELLLQFRRIWDQSLRSIAISQVKTLAESDIKAFQEAQRAEVDRLESKT